MNSQGLIAGEIINPLTEDWELPRYTTRIVPKPVLTSVYACDQKMVNLGMWPWAGRPLSLVHCSQSANHPHMPTHISPASHYLCLLTSPQPPFRASSILHTHVPPIPYTICKQLSGAQLELDDEFPSRGRVCFAETEIKAATLNLPACSHSELQGSQTANIGKVAMGWSQSKQKPWVVKCSNRDAQAGLMVWWR